VRPHEDRGQGSRSDAWHRAAAAQRRTPGHRPAVTGAWDEAERLQRAGVPVTCEDAGLAPQSAPAAAAAEAKQCADPKITPGIIGEGRYEIVKAPDHSETRAWLVLVGGKRAGLVRPTWRGERGRYGWEAVDNAGTALPATGVGRVGVPVGLVPGSAR
jgi:hypothetical protein